MLKLPGIEAAVSPWQCWKLKMDSSGSKDHWWGLGKSVHCHILSHMVTYNTYHIITVQQGAGGNFGVWCVCVCFSMPRRRPPVLLPLPQLERLPRHHILGPGCPQSEASTWGSKDLFCNAKIFVGLSSGATWANVHTDMNRSISCPSIARCSSWFLDYCAFRPRNVRSQRQVAWTGEVGRETGID